VDLFVSEFFVKVNIVKAKYLLALDVFDSLDHSHKDNQVRLTNDGFDIFLVKKQKKIWDDIFAVGTKEELKERRENSVAQLEEEKSKHREDSKNLRYELDRHTVDSQMKIDTKKRQEIRDRRQAEHDQAQREIMDEFKRKKYIPGEVEQDEEEEGELIEKPKPEEEEVVEVETDYSKSRTRDQTDSDEEKGDIFEENEVEEEEERDLPSVREAASVKLSFTERKYPNIAARERHGEEAPFPKAKDFYKESGDVADKNPVWLNDKGKEFVKNGDYHSALNAFAMAAKKDSTNLEYISHRCLCLMKTGQWIPAIEDAHLLVTAVEKKFETDDHSKDDQSLQKIFVQSMIRIATVEAWFGYFDESEAALDKALTLPGIKNEWNEEISRHRTLIKERRLSNETKSEGDALYRKGSIRDALAIYEKSAGNYNQNELIFANIAMTYLKLEEYEKCINACDSSLKLMEDFQSKACEMPYNPIRTKLFLRKAKALENLDKFEAALKQLEKAYSLDPRNSEVKKNLESVKDYLNFQKFEVEKRNADKLLREMKFPEALEAYKSCQRLLHKDRSMELVATVVNKCACFLGLDRFEDVIQETAKGLKTLKNFKNSPKFTKGDVEQKVRALELRLYLRAGGAMAKTNRLYQAKESYENALKIDPGNQMIKNDLETVLAQLSEKAN